MEAASSPLSEEAREARRWTEITLAVVQNRRDDLEDALAAGTPVNHQDGKDDTALHYAIWGAKDSLVPLLLQAGANPNLPNHKGQSPLHHACARRNAPLMAALIAAGGDLGQPDARALTPLMALARPAPSGIRDRAYGELSDAVLDLVVAHAGSAFWTEPVGEIWKAALLQTDGASSGTETWARLEAKGLARLMDEAGPTAAPRSGPSRRL